MKELKNETTTTTDARWWQ